MAAQHTRPTDRTAFEIALICALRIESDAVEAMFDEFWEDDDRGYDKAPGDPNSYTLGRIGRHNVVMAYMPGMGKASSAGVAASFRASFPNIRLGLVVGVCGGVPQPTIQDEEIFLGDIIISTGVVQFDFGSQLADRVIRKDTLQDSLGRPNQEIRAFLRKLQGWRGRSTLKQHISTYITAICKIKSFSNWHCPGIDEDKLYQHNYRHKHHDEATCTICAQRTQLDSPVCDAALGATCLQLQCDEHYLVTRERAKSISTNSAPPDDVASLVVPELHFGLIASGDVVMKSAMHRDRVAAEEQVIGFEMEGAGVWDNFPTIVIKGVCDYADSHKNKKWQNYAAVTAAACAKAMLGEWRGIEKAFIPAAQSIRDDLRSRVDIHEDRSQSGAVFHNYSNVGNQVGMQDIAGDLNISNA